MFFFVCFRYSKKVKGKGFKKLEDTIKEETVEEDEKGKEVEEEEEEEGEEGEEGSVKHGGKKSWIWRLIRCALPFHIALIALWCVAYLMESRCCDSLNNLESSLSPVLRYDFGPPPV